MNNVINDYPTIDNQSEIQFLILDANYKLAINSVSNKKIERLNNTIASYRYFAKNFPDDKSSIRSFISLITTDDRYKSVIDSTNKVEEMFKGMSPYAERKDYVNFLSSVYTDRIKPIIETQNMLIPRAKPLNQQMDNLQ